MDMLRALIRSHRRLALAGLLLAFCIKALIPAGFMPAASADTILTVAVCADYSGEAQTMRIVIPGKKDAGSPAGKSSGSDHCIGSSLAKVATGSVDPVLLELAFVFILAIGLARVVQPPLRRVFALRPPLRGPPALS